MPKFAVEVSESYSKAIEIEADSKEEAMELINEIEINMEAEDYVNDSFRIDSVEQIDKQVK